MLYTPAGSVLTATATGKVGVGTTAPQAKLDVRGDVKLGTNGQLFAAGVEENLRIIRGVIDVGGNIIVGSGFQVIHSNPPGEVKPFFTTKEKRCDHITRN